MWNDVRLECNISQLEISGGRLARNALQKAAQKKLSVTKYCHYLALNVYIDSLFIFPLFFGPQTHLAFQF